jgi:inosose dehydratase
VTEETQALRVANAPVSFGVFELTVDRADLPSGSTLADLIEDTGYAGTELGPPGFFGKTGEEVHEVLAGSGLALVGSFLPLRFSYKREFEEDLQGLDGTLTLLEEAADGAGLPTVLLSDAFIEPDRMRYAGKIEQHPETWLSAPRFGLLCDNAQRAAERVRERGFPVAFHYHAGTYVETPRELSQFAERVDPELLPLCFDSGHTAFGGGDPVAVLREFGELVRHVHLKDVDRKRMDAVYQSGGGLAEAWAAGVFVPLGEGDAEVETCLAELRRLGYSGWLVVEQDRVLRPGELEGAVEAQRQNRAFLKERGL